jgi:hypothetical protein
MAPQSVENKLFALMQEGARKDVECAFDVLQSCFDIVRQLARLWKQGGRYQHNASLCYPSQYDSGR